MTSGGEDDETIWLLLLINRIINHTTKDIFIIGGWFVLLHNVLGEL
tara:strand:+ start:585 stop:722 length:138 start_codon:yes stop_codon:yes gene_type:complete